MVVRRRKKIGGLRGTRHCGGGNIKNRRNKGSRGGKGYAGSHKHRWTYIVKYEPDHFSTKGFVSLSKKCLPVISLGRISEMAESGKLGKGEKLALDFEGKVLGGGSLSKAVSVKALCFSKSAEEKIKQAGGEAIVKTQASGRGGE